LVNEYQLWLGRQRQVWLIPIADERVGVHVKLWNPLRTRAIPERFCGGDSLRRGAISSAPLPLPFPQTTVISGVANKRITTDVVSCHFTVAASRQLAVQMG